MAHPALIVIDLQNDYFPSGKFPLWNTGPVLEHTLAAIRRAREKSLPVILVQHVADATRGPAPFFNPGSDGVAIHPDILAAAPDAPIITKHHADSFHETELERRLAEFGVDELLLAGMMTQNCVTHTALSKAAEKYAVTVLTDCTTTVSEILHRIALNALSTRVRLSPAEVALA